MEIPDSYECDMVSEAVRQTTKETISNHLPSAKHIEPSHTSVRTNNGHARLGIIQVTFGPEDRLKMGYVDELEEHTGLSLKAIRFDKNQAYFE